jgi:pilus assembly protein CpaB
MESMEGWTWTRSRNLWLAVAAIAVGGCAYALAHRYLRGQEAAVRQQLAGQFASGDVLVVAHDLPAGSVLGPSVLARRAVPLRFLAGDAVEARTAGEVLGRILARPLQAGEVVTLSALESVVDASLSSLVEPGLRAVTIPVDDSSAAAGMLSPGDHIDLLLVTRADDSAANAPTVRPLLQAVRVVATGQRLRRPRPTAPADRDAEDGHEMPTQFQTVTLHVSAENAERILLAQRLGELAVLLRHEGDIEPLALPLMDQASLLDVRPRRHAHGATRVEFIVGGLAGASHARRAAP